MLDPRVFFLGASWVMAVALLAVFLPGVANSQDENQSEHGVPKYEFAETLAEQEAQLERNPLLKRFAESRRELSNDRYRPIYHYVNPLSRVNDPNGLCYWKGRWHLFYQAYPPEHPVQHWGHAVSDDLIHWRDLPYAIYPGPEKKCFSGSTFVEDDRVIAAYHGIDEGTMMATSDDPLLLNWDKVGDDGAVISFKEQQESGEEYNIFDPCVWKQGEHYYALTAGQRNVGPGGKPVRAEFLHRSKDLRDWEYLHPFLEDDLYGLIGDDGACPYFWPIGDDKHILAHFSHMSGGKYLIGDYDTERQKFVVTGGGDFNFGAYGPGGIHAPSAYPDGDGGIITMFNMNEGRQHSGWNRIMSLPRRLTLRKDGFFNPLHIAPAGDIESLRTRHQHVEATELPANEEVVLEKVEGDALELIASFAPEKNQTIELNVLRSPGGEEATRIVFYRDRGMRTRRFSNQPRASVVSIDTTDSSRSGAVTVRPPELAPVELKPGEPLELRVFVDRSVVEVFVNGRQCLGVRVYPEREDSTGVSLKAHRRSGKLQSLDAWQMKDVYGLGRGGGDKKTRAES